MATDVKRGMTRRQEKAEATRQRVLDAALELFRTDGYTTATIAAIADAADVAVQTVYAVFGNKKAILDALRARAVTGEGGGPLRQRPDWQAMERERDPHRQLRLLATIATGIGATMGPLYEVMSGAATSDSDIAETFRRQQQARHDDQRHVAQVLARRGALREGLTAKDATDVMWVIASPSTYNNLVGERGWSRDKYEQWLGDTLIAALLATVTA
ncbi:MAG TPA: TetR family transcriptional regulator [Acidimicrobiales bacterium]|nr:TetR family transcriptional regulator [Acidimicrobiales bacterium]